MYRFSLKILLVLITLALVQSGYAQGDSSSIYKNVEQSVYQEMLPQAKEAMHAALQKLETLHKAVQFNEAEAVRLAEERRELEQLRLQAAEQKRKDEAAVIAARQAEAAKATAELAAQRAEQKRLDDMAAIERAAAKRIDDAERAEADLAAARERAHAQAEHEAAMRKQADEVAAEFASRRAAEAAEQKMRDAAPTMLAALREVRAFVKNKDALTIIDAAVKEAT